MSSITCDIGCQFTILNATFEIALTLRVSRAITLVKSTLVFFSAAVKKVKIVGAIADQSRP